MALLLPRHFAGTPPPVAAGTPAQQSVLPLHLEIKLPRMKGALASITGSPSLPSPPPHPPAAVAFKYANGDTLLNGQRD